MSETVAKVKTILTWIVAILIVTVLFVPYVLMFFYYKKRGKSIQLVPEFKILDSSKPTDSALDEAHKLVEKNSDILGRIR